MLWSTAKPSEKDYGTVDVVRVVFLKELHGVLKPELGFLSFLRLSIENEFSYIH